MLISNKHFPALGAIEVSPSLPYAAGKETARWYCGTISEDSIAQHGFLRLDQPATDKHPARTVFIEPGHVRRIEFINADELEQALHFWCY